MMLSELEVQKKKLKDLIQQKAFLRRQPHEKPFKLASGGTSPVFFDCKMVTQDPEGIALVGEIIYGMVKDYKLQGIGGIETGAIPICTAVSLISFEKGTPIPAFWVRHKVKEHGTMNKIEGGLKPNSKVVIVDDVTTEGNSVSEAVDEVLKMNCKIVEIITMVDREKGAHEKFENAGLKFSPLFKISDFKL
jgi:orotate phosphoribosyltransferase